ncbi:MAG: hypothetical protein ABEJ82_07135 [Haloplanus sp.]
MVDPTSDIGEDVDENSAPTCETCGKKILREPNHRVIARFDGGVVQQLHFCSDDCLDAWSDE